MEGLHEHDLEVIERLWGHRIDDELKTWLFDFYSFGGKLYEYHRKQKECCRKCRKDKEPCYCCGADIPFCEDPLLFQLVLIIHMHDTGRFEVDEDNFETARIKWQKGLRPDPSLPF